MLHRVPVTIPESWAGGIDSPQLVPPRGVVRADLDLTSPMIFRDPSPWRDEGW